MNISSRLLFMGTTLQLMLHEWLRDCFMNMSQLFALVSQTFKTWDALYISLNRKYQVLCYVYCSLQNVRFMHISFDLKLDGSYHLFCYIKIWIAIHISLYRKLCHATTYTLSYVILCFVHLTLFEILIYGILHEISLIELLSVIINKIIYIHEQ